MSNSRWLTVALPLLLFAQLQRAHACELLGAARPTTEGGHRFVRPEDIAALADIGTTPDVSDAPAITLSPDRKHLAFMLRVPVPKANSFCQSMLVISMVGKHGVRVVDTTSDLIRWESDVLGKARFPSGVAKAISPRWFADGKSIAYLKKVGGTVQIFRAWLDGRPGKAITHSPTDVIAFDFMPTGSDMLAITHPQEALELSEIETEGRETGFLYDDRYSPISGSRPFPRPSRASGVVVNVDTGATRAASGDELAAFHSRRGHPMAGMNADAAARTGRRAWVRPAEAFPNDLELYAETNTKTLVRCALAACHELEGSVWWANNGRSVRFIRREGTVNEATAVYEWNPERHMARRLYETDSLLLSCTPDGTSIICLRETSKLPRHVAAIDLSSGHVRLIFDPNPWFRSLSLGRVERMYWTNSFGLPTYGDLVFPTDYRQGKTYPLVIVQYQSRGFLRGGTGDEYPIYALAARGYFVLSFQRPRAIGFYRNPTSFTDVDRANLHDFEDRRSVFSSLDVIIERLSKQGLIDPNRIGITGLSDGASTVQFGVVNSNRFRAAIMSTCCWGRSQSALLGPSIAALYAQFGWPAITDPAPAFWSNISLVDNATRVRTPLLMEVSDDEYLTALEGYTALRAAGVPVELHVFPDEHHIKWQPAHRLAIYRRNIAWFDYWLKGLPSNQSLWPAESSRWDRAFAGAVRKPKADSARLP